VSCCRPRSITSCKLGRRFVASWPVFDNVSTCKALWSAACWCWPSCCLPAKSFPRTSLRCCCCLWRWWERHAHDCLADQPHLHNLGEHYVAKDREEKGWPIKQRQLRETERHGHRRKWKPHSDAHDNDGGDCELPARTAWMKGSFLLGMMCMISVWVMSDSTNALAPITLSMLPKLELAPMRTYLRMFPIKALPLQLMLALR
jgi:hypothetical protein